MTAGSPSRFRPRVQRRVAGWVDGLSRIGTQAQFYFQTLGSTKDVVIHYKVELFRLVAQMSLGVGALAVVGGTVVIVGFLTLSTGALVAAGYNQLPTSASRRSPVSRRRTSTCG